MRKTFRRWLYLGHRWAGIALCLLFIIWFASGAVMMYVPFPSLRAPERIAASPAIDWPKVRVAPGAALATLRLDRFPQEFRLGMSAGEPVYHVVTKDERRAVSASTGREILNVSSTKAKQIASAFRHARAASAEPLDHDQWVVTRAYKKMAPFWRIRMADAAATDIYVVQRTGDIVQNTTAYERRWNWAGSIPHWIYFEALRLRQDLWRQVVLWVSGAGLLGAVAGLWIGILRLRPRQRYRSGSVTPYCGWMRWHHLAGLAGGLFLITWVFSGWLSMSPWGGLRDGGEAEIVERYRQSRSAYPRVDPARIATIGAGASEVRFDYASGRPVAIIFYPAGSASLVDGTTGTPFTPSTEQLVAAARAAMPHVRLVSVERLTRYDSYWYATGKSQQSERPLPILRLKFADDARTWLHVDPATGQLLGTLGRGGRADRWLFNALHCFDLPLLLERRPFRDVLMWLLSASGLVISLSGAVIGWRRLRPHKTRSIAA